MLHFSLECIFFASAEVCIRIIFKDRSEICIRFFCFSVIIIVSLTVCCL